MRDFLKDYWPWIAIPFGLVLLAVVALWYFAGGEGTNGFVYPIMGGGGSGR